MSLYEAVLAHPHEPAAALASRLKVSERTVYRYRVRKSPPLGSSCIGRDKAAREQMAQVVLRVVLRADGDPRAIRAELKALGVNRKSAAYMRDRLIRAGRISAEHWPLSRELGRKDERLLLAMVRAGASPLQVGRCFGLTPTMATKEIRAAWALIDLERDAQEASAA